MLCYDVFLVDKYCCILLTQYQNAAIKKTAIQHCWVAVFLKKQISKGCGISFFLGSVVREVLAYRTSLYLRLYRSG